MIEEVRETNSWDILTKNPKFQEEFQKVVSYYEKNIGKATIEHADNVIIVSYQSGVINRDLDCQLDEFVRVMFSIDEDNNLVINELNGKVESNYGYTFNNTNGGIFKTHYSTRVFDKDGIELAYQSYGDKFHLDNYEFKDYASDLKGVVLGAFNPNLGTLANVTGVYPHPAIIGKDARFIRHFRSKNDLGIVEVTRCSFNPDANIKDLSEEYYFNTFFVSPTKQFPELIHITSGFPFATISKDNNVIIEKDYLALGLSDTNYRDVARDRFQKELIEEKANIKNDDILLKYDLVLDRLENEEKLTKRIH